MVSFHSLGLLWLGAQCVTSASAHTHNGHGHFHMRHERQQSSHLPASSQAFTIGGEPATTVSIPRKPVGTSPPLPPGSPQPPPAYMRDNVNNFFGSAPDQGSMTGPVLTPLNATADAKMHHARRSTDDYWLSSLGSDGSSPFAPSGYQFFRNVMDFGAVGDGVTDDTAAINRAVASFSASDDSTLRCGEDCGSSSTLGAVVYFPAGTYLISTPIVQYYYTQFVGNPNSKPVIQGSENFTGIALFDSDFYVPGGNGSEWYINQSNFYRQIRNFVFDMTSMNWTNTDNNQTYVPAGVHWQVGQATSITNCDFKMAVSADGQAATAVGIYMENGSGGMVSDLTFTGGNIGFLAGSQQFTAINLQFTSCLTAIKSVWNWGINWKNIYVLSCYIAIDATEYSGTGDQGTGSISVVDSHFNGVPYGITVAQKDGWQPHIVLDNLLVENSAAVVMISGGDTILEGSTDALYFNSWSMGYRYLPDGSGGKQTGFLDPAPEKPEVLLDSSGAYYRRAKPQYESETPVVATSNGISNDGTGDQTDAINSLLASSVGSVVYFPAGVYLVEDTVKVPVGSKIIGSGWSQIMGTGSAFEDEENPKVMVQVGEEGDEGVIEITDMLFTVKGPTAGAVLVEWNVHESTQGSAAMWDSHFRVGGTTASDLGLDNCPTGSGVSKDCMGAALLMHVTSSASGYFENVWGWVADHDLDSKLNAAASESTAGIPLNVQTDVSVYVGRGFLIESQGPTWLYGTASEHAQMYQYQLANAANVYLGHMQTETPYYQPSPDATGPYTAGVGNFASDPTFDNCDEDDSSCRGAWALRVINSTDVLIYSAGFYSFFQDYDEGCIDTETCQLALVETNYADGLYIYNLFTKGNEQIVSPDGSLAPLMFNDTTRNGFTSEIAAWLALSTGGSDIGSNGNDSGIVYIDPIIWTEPDNDTIVQCYPPCTYVLPPTTLSSATTFVYPTLTTEIGVGYQVPYTFTYNGTISTTTSYIMSTTTSTITIPDVVTSIVPFYNVPIGNGTTSTVITPEPSIIQTAFNITWPAMTYNGSIYSSTVVPFYPPPWPGTTVPSDVPTSTTEPTKTTTSSTTTAVGIIIPPGGTHHVTHHRGEPKPKCTNRAVCGESCHEGILGGLNAIFKVCEHCWTDCGGGKSPNKNGNDPNRPKPVPTGSPGDEDEECETSTYSSCNVACVTQASTSSCSTSCKDVVGCDTTATTTSDIYSAAPVLLGGVEPWDDYNDDIYTADWDAAWSIYSAYGTATAAPGAATTTNGPTATAGQPSTTTATTTTSGANSSPTIGCTPHQDPDSGSSDTNCVCPGYDGYLPTLSGSAGLCGYTALPSSTSTTAPPTTKNNNPYPFTSTDFWGDVIACESSTTTNYAGYDFTFCAGSSTTEKSVTVTQTATIATSVLSNLCEGGDYYSCVSDIISFGMASCPSLPRAHAACQRQVFENAQLECERLCTMTATSYTTTITTVPA
ncbi:pectin lyase-like protein [Aspergillus indologenus CBS 114.80]|uniref:Pectin lyase-like protein n=1 Tax=Aspergillus indologenus CBS 114.80 TaxID=1450541 RepID=A0A2V5JA64_9EURO|nr:pectin lyase-like protein [Aspergillus indologenus CBS 114.80]